MTFGKIIDNLITPYWPLAASICGGAIISYIDIFDVKSPPWFWSAIFLILIGSIDIFVKLKKLEKIEKENSKLKQEIKANDQYKSAQGNEIAREIFQELKLSQRNRLTIYKFNEKDQTFTLFGRFADHHEYRMVSGRSYKANQGVIGKAWIEDEAFEPALPSPKPNSNNLERYLKACEEKWRIPRDVANSFKMKSTCLWGYALRNKKDGIKFGLLIIESTKRNNINKESIRKNFIDNHADQLVRYMTAVDSAKMPLAKVQEMGL